MFLPEETPGSAYTGSYQASPAGGAPPAVMGGTGFGLGASEAAASRSLLDLSQGYRELPATSMPSITPGKQSSVFHQARTHSGAQLENRH